jgi:hypothetical protein
MQISTTTLVLGGALLVAGAFALGRQSSPPEPPPIVQPAAGPAPAETETEALPPDHPPVGAAGMGAGGMGGAAGGNEFKADDEPAAIEWTVPSAWRKVPNSSSMRLATYAVPHAPSDGVDADVSVTRAGGDTSSNITRWAGQFEGSAPPEPKTRTVHGIEVTTVEIKGTYTNSMNAAGKPQTGWALLAAIVKTPGMPYFFKMTGPAATVEAARGAFTAMIDGIHTAE